MSKVMAQQVATVIERLYCMKCGDGHNEMEASGPELREMGCKPVFVHKCVSCDYAEAVVGHTYPRSVEMAVGEPFPVLTNPIQE